jgi:uncharacterized protein with FMN-binding domain
VTPIARMTNRRFAAIALVTGFAMTAAAAVPTSAAAPVKPKHGKYAVALTTTNGGFPQFTITKRLKVINFTGTAPTATGCTITGGYESPNTAPKIKNGRFIASSSDYGSPSVLVTIKGTFVTDTKVVGHLIVKYKSNKHKKCNATTRYVATRQ